MNRFASIATVVALGLALACVEASDTSSAARSPTPERPAWAGLAVDHWLPGPYRRGRPSEDRSELEAGCRNCHADIAREWRASQHASSWSSAAFQAAFALEPLGFCQGCHAPEVPANEAVPRWAAEIGTGCVTCHVEPGTQSIWSASSSDGAAHPVRATVAFAGPQACAACHEFEFPDAAVREQPLAMQSTIREHAASAYAERSCADCHMPMVDGHRSHAFVGAYDHEMLARSLIVTASRAGDRVTLSLRPGEVGHAVPTGDLLRRLEVRVDAIEPDGRERNLGRRFLGRRFGPIQQHGLSLRGELEDTRVGPDGVTLEFAVPEPQRELPLRWTITHQRVADASSDPGRAHVEGQLEVASGILEGIRP